MNTVDKRCGTPYVLAIDQGTTGTRAVIYDRNGMPVKSAYREFPQIYPKPGWVAHDPEAIWESVTATVRESVSALPASSIAAVGITNQRETTALWDRATGTPIHHAVVWQCRRTSDLCQKLKHHDNTVRRKTGLAIDPYFSATKIRWLLDNVHVPNPEQLCFGTMDSWLIWKLTGGKVHATDVTNASRTLLLDIDRCCWDVELCRLFGVPEAILPEVRDSIADYGSITTIPELEGVPIRGVAGDQQAALFGQNCVRKGQIKNTYGTGCFVLLNTGDARVESTHGLLTTVAVDSDGRPCYALEGSIFAAGAAVQWLRDELKFIRDSSETAAIAESVENCGGVYLVPAFSGLGTPHWDPAARGLLTGLTRGTRRAHIVRAALEAMAYQSHDVLRIMQEEAGLHIETLAADGGAAANDFLMQFQADIIDAPVVRPLVTESTSLGAAYLAGLGCGVWKNTAELSDHRQVERVFEPSMCASTREQLIRGWNTAVRQTLTH